MPLYNGHTYQIVYEQVVIDKLEEIINDNIFYGVMMSSLDHALERNDNLFNDIIEASSVTFESTPFANLQDGTPVFRIEFDAIRFSGNTAFQGGVPTNTPIKHGGTRRAKNLRYFVFIIFDGVQFVVKQLFGSTQNWKDGYLKDELKATINESLCRFNRHVFLSHYLERGRRAIKRSLYS